MDASAEPAAPTGRPALGLVLADHGTTIPERVALAQEAERAGFDVVHAVEAARTAIAALAAIAVGTSRIRFGPYAANAYARTPGLMALTALDLDELGDGRLDLCVAAGNRHLNHDVHGLEMERPAGRMADYLRILRRMLAAGPDDEVSFEGEHLRMGPWRPTAPAPAVPVLLAAVQPAMVRAAARHADGVALGILTSPAHLRETVLPLVRETADAAGRDPHEVRVTVALSTVVDPDHEAAREQARRMVCGLFAPLPHPYYEHLLREQGFGAVVEQLGTLAPAGRWREALAAVPDELLDTLTAAGDATACQRRIEEYAGLVDEVALVSARGPLTTAAPWADATRTLLALGPSAVSAP